MADIPVNTTTWAAAESNGSNSRNAGSNGSNSAGPNGSNGKFLRPPSGKSIRSAGVVKSPYLTAVKSGSGQIAEDHNAASPPPASLLPAQAARANSAHTRQSGPDYDVGAIEAARRGSDGTAFPGDTLSPPGAANGSNSNSARSNGSNAAGANSARPGSAHHLTTPGFDHEALMVKSAAFPAHQLLALLPPGFDHSRLQKLSNGSNAENGSSGQKGSNGGP